MARKKKDPIPPLPDDPEADALIARHDEIVRKFHADREAAAGGPEHAADHGEEGDFTEEDFAAADRARENIAARRAAGIPDDEDDDEDDDWPGPIDDPDDEAAPDRS